MVGNSVQDIGALGGVAGSAGVALGQMAEYAADGNISLGGLAKVAGPLAGLAVGFQVISDIMGKQKKVQEALRKDLDKLDKAHEETKGTGVSAAKALAAQWEADGKKITAVINGTVVEGFEDASDIMRETFGDVETDISDDLTRLGLNAETFARMALGSAGAVQEWADKSIAAGASTDDVNRIVESAAYWHKQNSKWTEQDAINTKLFGDNAKAAAPKVNTFEKATRGLKGALQDAADRTQFLNDQLTLLYGNLDEQDSWANIQTKLKELRDGEGDAEQEMRDLIRSYADFITESDKIDEEKKIELIASLNAGDVKVVEDYLRKWAKGVIVPITFSYPNGQRPVVVGGGAGQTPDGERSTRAATNGLTVNVSAGVIADKEAVGRIVTEAIQREFKNGTRYPWMGNT